MDLLAIEVDQAVELALALHAVLGGRFGIVGQPRSRKVERVDEHQRRSASQAAAARSHFAQEPLAVFLVLIVLGHALEIVFKRRVERLGGKVANHVGRVSALKRDEPLVTIGACKALNHHGIRSVQPARLDHCILVLQQQLDTLDWRSGSLYSRKAPVQSASLTKAIGTERTG